MSKSGLLERQKQQRQLYMDITERIMKQFMLDTLHDEGWGYKRILDLTEKWGAKYSTYYKALGTSVEADYLRFAMDRELSDIIKDNMEFAPFEVRYPEIKKITYGGK